MFDNCKGSESKVVVSGGFPLHYRTKSEYLGDGSERACDTRLMFSSRNASGSEDSDSVLTRRIPASLLYSVGLVPSRSLRRRTCALTNGD